MRGRTAASLAVLAVLAVLVATAGCGGRARIPPGEPAPGAHEVGLASWVGHEFHGRRTASGERYDENRLTAAHRTLPFGTRIRVTNLSNGRSVEVRVTDRGPFKKGRIVDLSFRAAREIEMVRDGVVRVRLEVLEVPGG